MPTVDLADALRAGDSNLVDASATLSDYAAVVPTDDWCQTVYGENSLGTGPDSEVITQKAGSLMLEWGVGTDNRFGQNMVGDTEFVEDPDAALRSSGTHGMLGYDTGTDGYDSIVHVTVTWHCDLSWGGVDGDPNGAYDYLNKQVGPCMWINPSGNWYQQSNSTNYGNMGGAIWNDVSLSWTTYMVNAWTGNKNLWLEPEYYQLNPNFTNLGTNAPVSPSFDIEMETNGDGTLDVRWNGSTIANDVAIPTQYSNTGLTVHGVHALDIMRTAGQSHWAWTVSPTSGGYTLPATAWTERPGVTFDCTVEW